MRYLKDPILGVTINQWRNICAHKSFKIDKDIITISYGRKTIRHATLTYENLNDVIKWIMNVYRVLRLAEVLIDLNFISDIAENVGEIDKIEVRFESSMMHLIHNMQIVGFEFISTEKNDKNFIIKFKKKKNDNLKSSIIHASQCLDSLSLAIYQDKFLRDEFNKVEVQVMDLDNKLIASARIKIEVALRKLEEEITLDEYLNNMVFNTTNYL